LDLWEGAFVKSERAPVLEIGKRPLRPFAGRANAEQGCDRRANRLCTIAEAAGDILAHGRGAISEAA
jgi:hypothetical protein